MDFQDQIKVFATRVEKLIETVQTEEATKTSLIMPFFSMLGYDVFNPEEFVPEFVADVGIKKGEKVDYAIFVGGTPTILIEAKWAGEKLEKHDSQLFRYFGTSTAKFAILTNGRHYRFYTDLEETNKMDERPFLEIDLLNLKDTQIPEIKKFSKANFDINTIFDSASELKYSNEFKIIFKEELDNPSDDLIRLFLKNVYDGLKTQTVIDRFKPVLKKSLNNYISELMSERISTALGSQTTIPPTEETSEKNEYENISKIITTPEEIESYYIVKSIIIDLVEPDRISFKDNERYFSVLIDNNVRKQICRLNLDGRKKYIMIPDQDKNFIKYEIADINDIYKLKDELRHSLTLLI